MDLPNQGSELRSLTLQADYLPSGHQKPKNTGVVAYLLQDLLTQRSGGVSCCRQTLYQLSYQGSRQSFLFQTLARPILVTVIKLSILPLFSTPSPRRGSSTYLSWSHWLTTEDAVPLLIKQDVSLVY